MEEKEKYVANYGTFKAIGVIESIRLTREGKTKNNADYKALEVKIKVGKDRYFTAELFGSVMNELELIKFKGKEKETRKIKWADRLNLPEGFNLQGYQSVKMSTEVGAKDGTRTLTTYDAVSEILNGFKIGDSVYLEGSINWQSYTSRDGDIRTSKRFSISKIYKNTDIDFEDENYKEVCHFVQPIVVESTEFNEDKTNLIVNAIIVLNKKGSFVRTSMNVSIENRGKLAKNLHSKSVVPRYSIIPVSGDIINRVITTEIVSEDDEWGFDANEVTHQSTGVNLEILQAKGAEMQEKYYTENDFIYDVLSNDTTVDINEDSIFDIENTDEDADDTSWLNEE